MNWAQNTKKLLAIAMLYAACATPSIIARNCKNLADDADQTTTRKTKHAIRSQDKKNHVRNKKDNHKKLKIAPKYTYHQPRSLYYTDLYAHGPMYGDPNVPGR
jgi:Ni/Co efflux regulator RcnB